MYVYIYISFYIHSQDRVRLEYVWVRESRSGFTRGSLRPVIVSIHLEGTRNVHVTHTYIHTYIHMVKSLYPKTCSPVCILIYKYIQIYVWSSTSWLSEWNVFTWYVCFQNQFRSIVGNVNTKLTTRAALCAGVSFVSPSLDGLLIRLDFSSSSSPGGRSASWSWKNHQAIYTVDNIEETHSHPLLPLHGPVPWSHFCFAYFAFALIWISTSTVLVLLLHRFGETTRITKGDSFSYKSTEPYSHQND